jgi:molybdopterin molybdotransferase
MLAPDAAWKIVLDSVQLLESVRSPLMEAFGFCLAEPVRADRDIPPTDRSAMDGYAVRSEDLRSAPCALKLAGEIPAGSPAKLRVRPGCCIRIYTGASLPAGADAVAIIEQAQEDNDRVRFKTSVQPGQNILRRGEDARKGALLLSAGTRIGAAETGICAAVGKAQIRVHRRPRVTILCTGSELVSVDERPAGHAIRNSAGPTITAALAQWGFPGARFVTLGDERRTIAAALRRALRNHDVILVTGGISVGRYDFVPEAIRAVGGEIRFHGVAMKPGKPSLYAAFGTNQHIFGLPGNPLSALTALHEYALPALRRLSGQPPERCRPSLFLPLAEEVESKPGRWRYQLARLEATARGLAVAPVGSHSSADLPSAGGADGVIRMAPDQRRLPEGEAVEFRPWRPWP